MSALAGAMSAEGTRSATPPVGPALVAMAHLGGDGVGAWEAPGGALIHLARHTTPEAVAERWPLEAPDGAIWIADARLDNRDDLIAALRPERRPGRPVTDAELLVAAHERWGLDAPARLVGDFAYARWCPRDRRLLLVRGPVGLRGLFYRHDRGRLTFASTLEGLRAMGGSQTLDEPWVASFLTRRMDRLHDRTLYREIRKLPPAHLLLFDAHRDRVEVRRFWRLEPNGAGSGWSEQRWIESFRETLELAVAASMRGVGPRAIAVSGGLDSTSIALLAQRLAPATPVLTVTLTTPGWPACDERDYQRAALAALPAFESLRVECPVPWRWSDVERWHASLSTPSAFPNAWMWRPAYERLKEAGCRIKISGAGGDIVTGGEDYYLLETLESLRADEALAELPHFAARAGGAPRLARRWLRRRAPRTVDRLYSRMRPWPRLTTARCERRAGAPHPSDPVDGLTPIQTLFREFLSHPKGLQPFEQRAEILALYGLELRCPFYDRRLLELAFDMPASLRVRGGRSRWLLREALADLLPGPIATRESKADFTGYTALAVPDDDHARAAALPARGFLRTRGWIDWSRWQRWAADRDDPMHPLAIHCAAHVEQWVATRVGSETGSTGEPRGPVVTPL